MAWHRTVVSPLLMHRRYHSLVLSHQNIPPQWFQSYLLDCNSKEQSYFHDLVQKRCKLHRRRTLVTSLLHWPIYCKRPFQNMDHLSRCRIPIIKIRLPFDSIKFITGIPILVKQHIWYGNSPCGGGYWILNSLWLIDTIWHQRSWSTLVQVMAFCLTAPSHYLNLCWLITSDVQWQSPECHKRYISHRPSVIKISLKIYL